MSLDTSLFPYSTVVRITDSFGQGSGVLIAPDEVLTASHVVYLQAGGVATNIHVTPEASYSAQTGLETAPLGYALAAFVHYNFILDGGGTLTYAQSQSDFAVIHLSQSFAGLGVMSILPDFSGGAVNVLGYPAITGGNLDLASVSVQVNPTYSILQGPTFGTNISPGSSGGPAFAGGLASPAIVGLVSTGGSGVENYTQITQSVFNQIAAWVKSDDGSTLQAATTKVAAPPPVISTTVQGNHGDYLVANNGGALYLADTLAGRDGTHTLATVTHITFADGTGRFDASGGAEQVARLYRAAFDRTADLGGLDNWAAQIDAHTLGIAGVATSFIAAPEFTARYGTPDGTDFVRRLYHNVLGRDADAGGLQNWVSQLDAGMTRGQVLTDFSESFENRADTLATIGDGNLSEAYRLYQAAFARTPDAGGLAAWTGQLDQGQSAQQIAAGMTASAEFTADYAGLDTSGFVNRLYQNALHRTGDAGGVQNWIAQINAGQSRSSVVLAFSDSIENRIGTAAATHDAWVFLPS